MNIPIRLVTINTWKGDGAYSERIRVLARQLQDLKPDVIVCQECFQSVDLSISTINFLAEKLAMHKLFAPARLKQRLVNGNAMQSFSGLGVLSVFPITSLTVLTLPTSPLDGERKAQLISINIQNQYSLAIANIHLTHLGNAQELRIKQLGTVVNNLNTYTNCQAKIICGDFNVEASSPEISFIMNTYGAMDAYTLGGGTYPRTCESVQSGLPVTRSIDHIFSFPDSTGRHPEFSDSCNVLDQPDSIHGIYASDHPGVLTTIHCTV